MMSDVDEKCQFRAPIVVLAPFTLQGRRSHPWSAINAIHADGSAIEQTLDLVVL